MSFFPSDKAKHPAEMNESCQQLQWTPVLTQSLESLPTNGCVGYATLARGAEVRMFEKNCECLNCECPKLISRG